VLVNKLEDMIITGENYRMEFKESVDKTFVEEATAFANASGGTILIGVRDNGTIKGTDTSNAAISRIQDSLMQIKPHINVDIEIVKNVVAVYVAEGKNKPYACSKGFFIRMGANSQKLDRDEIIDFFQSEGRIIFDEMINKKVQLETVLDEDTYENYLKKANISNVLPISETMINLNCVVEQDEKYYLNNSGILFFAKKPTQFLSHAYVVCALFKGLDKEIVLDRKEFTGDILSNIEDTIIFLKKHLNLRYEIKSVRRKEILDIPEVALREAVINAHCHRDYFEKGAQIMVEIYDDRVVITNPGGVPKGIDANKFGKISITRNPNIASLLQRANYIEKMGTGISRITNAMQSVGLPLPNFELEGFFMVTLMRDSYIKRKNGGQLSITDTDDTDNDTDTDTDDTDNDTDKKETSLKRIEERVINLIEVNKNISINEIVEKTNKSRSTIQRTINKLKNSEKLMRVGNTKTGHWVIIKNIGENGHE